MESAKSPLQSVFDYGQRMVALAAYIIILGYIVTSIVIGRQASFASYAVYPQQYLYYGSILVIAFFNKILFPVLLVSLMLMFLFWLVLIRRITNKLDIKLTYKTTLEMARYIYSLPITWLLLFVWLILIAATPDTVFSFQLASTPSASITIILKENIDPALWSLATKVGQPRSTQPLYPLAQYTDGYLVKDVKTGVVVEIKNDMIAGIIYNPPPASTTLPTITVTPATIPTP